jgi:hypothetical protein
MRRNKRKPKIRKKNTEAQVGIELKTTPFALFYTT